MEDPSSLVEPIHHLRITEEEAEEPHTDRSFISTGSTSSPSRPETPFLVETTKEPNSTNNSRPSTACSPEELQQRHRLAFEQLYQDFPLQITKQASKEERKKNGYYSTTLVYGEIAYDPFQSVIELLKQKQYALVRPGGIFFDIGSGSGKAIFAGALQHDFDACIGMEILENLHEISIKILEKWEKNIKKPLSLLKKRTRINFLLGDALEDDWPANIDLLFMNSTCFGEKLMRELTKKIIQVCKIGCIIITATFEIPLVNFFEKLETIKVQQETWGEATWFIYKKIQ